MAKLQNFCIFPKTYKLCSDTKRKKMDLQESHIRKLKLYLQQLTPAAKMRYVTNTIKKLTEHYYNFKPKKYEV